MKLDENASVKNISQVLDDIKNEFMRAQAESDNIVFDFSDLRRIDLAVAQVIIAAVRKAASRGIRVGIRSAGDDVRRQLYICGLKI